MKSIARHCDQCGRYGEAPALSQSPIACPHCRHAWGRIEDGSAVFEYCPVCRGRQFYTSKDFNQFLGCLVMLVGIVLVPFTYGLSLPVFALVDWLLHRRVPTLINCYKCGTEFRGFPNDRNFKPFLHHIGLKYDKYR
jgi:hypothetical protein